MARVSARLLEGMGFHIAVFSDARDALTAFRMTPFAFDAVLTDLSMPYMSGLEFVRLIKEIRNDIPVVVSTGLSLTAAQAAEARVDEVLLKPWRIEHAVATLQKLLR
jgi:two-component system cell cycle sensor histidine kinase/response regulator CckA